MIKVDNLTKAFDGKAVLSDVNTEFSDGIYMLTGPSGSGKTTFARILGGLETPDSGTISGRGAVSFMFQEPRLFPWMNLRSNIVSVTDCSRQVADELLTELELYNDRGKLPGELSGGMQRRAALARTLSAKADLYIFDEPLSGLDDKLKRTACDIIRRWISGGKTALIITHDISEVSEIADHHLKLKNGKITE